MNTSDTIQTLKLSIFLTLVVPVMALATGKGSDGGGNEKEGDFISLARIINQRLEKSSQKSSEMLGFDIVELKNAIDVTDVHCAIGDTLTLMREIRKTAYYTKTNNQINLDCDNYEAAKKKGELGPITIFHEYMRAIGKEGSEYGISSKLLLVFFDMGQLKGELLIDSGIVKCYNEFKVAREPSLGPDSGFRDMFGRQVARCLAEQGLNEKVNRTNSSAEIMSKLGNVIERDLSNFNAIVSSLLRRP